MSHPVLETSGRSWALLIVLLVGVVLVVFGPLVAACCVALAVALFFGTGPVKTAGRAATVNVAGCTDCPGCGSHQVDVVRAGECDADHELRWACFACDSTWAIH